MLEDRDLYCEKCDRWLIPQKVKFLYLGNQMEHKVPVCPRCGQIYVSEKLVLGKIVEIERMLEEK